MDTVEAALDSCTMHLLGRCAPSLVRRPSDPTKADEALRVHSLSDIWRALVCEKAALPLVDDVSGTRIAQLGRLYDEQERAYEANGIGDLLVCLGYLTLPIEVGGHIEPQIAPVVIIPAQLVRGQGPDGAAYSVLAAGRPVLDPIVAHGLRAGCGIEPPEPDASSADAVETFLDEVEALLEARPGKSDDLASGAPGDDPACDCWVLTRESGLLCAPGGALALQGDLKRHAARILRSPLVACMDLGGTRGADGSDGDAPVADAPAPASAPDPGANAAPERSAAPAGEPRVVHLGAGAPSPADAGLLEGDESFVLDVQGAAGGDTALADTALADLVARRVRSGRRVLFVSSRDGGGAAVKERFEGEGMADRILDLSGGALSGDGVRDILMKALEGCDEPHPYPAEPLHLTTGQASSYAARLLDAPELPADALGAGVLGTIGSVEANDLRDRLDALSRYSVSLGKFADGVEACPWYGANVEAVDHDFRAEARLRLDELNLKAKQANITYQTMERETGMSFEPTVGALDDAAALFDQIAARPALPPSWTLATDFDALEALRSAWEARSAELVGRVHELHDRAVAVLGETADDEPSGHAPDARDAAPDGPSEVAVAPGEAPEPGPTVDAGDAGAIATGPAAAEPPGDDAGGAPRQAPDLPTAEFVAVLGAHGGAGGDADGRDAEDGDGRAPDPAVAVGPAPSVGEVSERPGYIDEGDDLRASTAIDRYAKLVIDAVGDRIAGDPCYANWAASRIGDVRATATRLEQFLAASLNLRGAILRDYGSDVLQVDYETVESRFPAENASWFKRLFNFTHRRDMKALARLRKEEAGGMRGYRDADALDVLKRLRALDRVRNNIEADTPEYRARFGSLYTGEGTDLSAISAKLDAYDELVDLRDLARDMESGIVWADLDAAALPDAFGPLYAGDAVATNWGGRVRSNLEWARSYRDRAVALRVEGSEFVRRVMGSAEPLDGETQEKCARWAQRLHDTVDACAQHQRWFAGCFADPAEILSLPVPDLAARANVCVNDLRSLENWAGYQRDLAECAGLGLGGFIEAARAAEVPPEQVAPAFERAFWPAWSGWVEAERAGEADRLMRSATPGDLGDCASPAPDGQPVCAPVSASGLVSDIPDLTARLKPCILATPEVSAALFGQGDFMFDTVVFVEGGVEPSADVDGGLSALARAHQAIVVRGMRP